MNRRRFLSTVVQCGVGLGAPVGWLAKRARSVPARFTEAIRGGGRPRRSVEIDPDSVQRPGRWAG